MKSHSCYIISSIFVVAILSLLFGCQSAPAPTAPTLITPTAIVALQVAGTGSTNVPAPAAEKPAYLDPALPVSTRVDDLLARMTLEEKVGQMTQVENYSIRPEDITQKFIGSLLSGGGGSPSPNTATEWANMTNGFQAYALKTHLKIPLIYGVDAVHGHGNLYGATIFPHNIGLGATRDAGLVERIGRATAEEMAATGIWWNFGPVVAVPQDIRWGRIYEGYSEDTDLVSKLSSAYIHGLQDSNGKTNLSDPATVLATAKHFIGDGGALWGTSTTVNSGQRYMIDQGDMQVDQKTLREKFLPPYQAAIDAGVQSIMVSFSSWNGVKMHAQKQLLTDLLKGELGFNGFLVSDWAGIDQLPGSYEDQIATAINSGLDMIMVPDRYSEFIADLTKVVKNGRVTPERIDDAVRRILTAKFELGLFEHPMSDPRILETVGSAAHRKIAREAVQKSLVLLKNENNTLPLSKDTPVIFVAGSAANDIGRQCGGWTIEWQGKSGNITPGITILEGIQQLVSAQTRIEFSRLGDFADLKDGKGKLLQANVGIAIVGEDPYAEGQGDRADLTLSHNDVDLINYVKERSKKVVVILVSGRPLIVTKNLPKWDAFVAAWLPGTEGSGVADVLFGDAPFTGKLPYAWPRWNQQLPLGGKDLPKEGCDAPLFPFGFGLSTTAPSPKQLACPQP